MKLRDLKVGTKLIVGFSLVIMLTMAVSVAGWRGMQNLSALSAKVEKIDSIVILVFDGRRYEKDFMINRDEHSRDRHQLKIDGIIAVGYNYLTSTKDSGEIMEMDSILDKVTIYNEWFLKYARNVFAEKVKLSKIDSLTFVIQSRLERLGDDNSKYRLLSNYLGAVKNEQEYIMNHDQQLYDNWNDKIQKAHKYLARGSALEKTFDNYEQLFIDYYQGIQEKNGLGANMSKTAYAAKEYAIKVKANLIEKMNRGKQRVRLSIFIFAIGSILTGILISWFITRSITIPLRKGVVFIQEVSGGNLTSEIELERKDEIGQLTEALSKMAQELRSIMKEIISNAEFVSIASMQISSTSQELSQGAAEQAYASESISASISGMVSNVEVSGQNVAKTKAITEITSNSVSDGSESATESADVMRQISKKNSMISDIAFQTNLLALNAAVEAARAAGYGRGFSVVAGEVKKLADQSKVLASEITKLTIHGLMVSDKAAKQLHSLVPEINNTLELVNEINEMNHQQSHSADEINNAMYQLNQTVQANASASEELASNAEELSGQAVKLKEMVARFKV